MKKAVYCCTFLLITLVSFAVADGDWTEKTKSGAKPIARCLHNMAWAGDDKVLLFGGFSYLDDTWLYDLGSNTWAEQSVSTSPRGRRSHGMAHLSADKVLLFGGYSNIGDLGDTWIYDRLGNSWSQKDISPSPSARNDCGMAYIGGDRVLLFSGYNTGYLGDTWIYNSYDNTWTDKNPAGDIPSGRRHHSLAYIGQDKVMLFGGYNGSYLDDTRIYDLSDNTWTNKNPTGDIPSAREGYSLAYIGGDRVMLFGGYDGSVIYGDTWIYDLSANSWTLDPNTTQPADRFAVRLSETSMDGSGDLVLFGGATGHYSWYETGFLNDTWTFSSPLNETEPNNEYGDPGIIVISSNKTFTGEVKKRSDYSDLWYIKAGSSGPLTIKNISEANVQMDICSFSNNYGGPGNMIKHIVRLRPGSSRQVNLNSDRYYVINVYVPFFKSSGGSYKFTISGDWTAPVELTKEKAELENNKDGLWEVKVAPEEFNLYQNYPNPFNPSTEIVFNLEQESDVSLKIYNVSGQLVTTLVSGHRTAGIHRITWDATDESGLRVGSGLYIAIVRAGDMVAQTKMMFAK